MSSPKKVSTAQVKLQALLCSTLLQINEMPYVDTDTVDFKQTAAKITTALSQQRIDGRPVIPEHKDPRCRKSEV